jgi:hypothetical protein
VVAAQNNGIDVSADECPDRAVQPLLIRPMIMRSPLQPSKLIIQKTAQPKVRLT